MASPWPRVLAGVLAALGAAVVAIAARDPKAALQEDLKDLDIVGDWNYDSIDAAFARAAREKKPVCIVFR